MSHTDDAYNAVRRQIVDGTFQPGHRLVEADLVATLTTSRAHVRDALARLEADGLVHKAPGKSCVVRHLQIGELLEIVDARIALEAIVVRAAAEQSSAHENEVLNGLIDALEESSAAGDIARVMQHQADIHHHIAETSKLSVAPRIIHQLTALTARSRMQTMMLPGRISASVDEHRSIAVAVLEGDPDKAVQAMTTHLRNVRAAIVRMPAKELGVNHGIGLIA